MVTHTRRGAGIILSKSKPRNLDQPRAYRARQQAIGLKLRRLYDSVLQEPLPDDFLELLKRMDARDKNPTGNGLL